MSKYSNVTYCHEGLDYHNTRVLYLPVYLLRSSLLASLVLVCLCIFELSVVRQPVQEGTESRKRVNPKQSTPTLFLYSRATLAVFNYNTPLTIPPAVPLSQTELLRRTSEALRYRCGRALGLYIRGRRISVGWERSGSSVSGTFLVTPLGKVW